MNPKFTYSRRNPDVQAVWWNGDNRDEVIEFFRDCGLPNDSGPYFSRDEEPDDEYDMVTGYWNDDMEFDVKSWIVFDEDDYRSWTRVEFRAIFGIDVPS